MSEILTTLMSVLDEEHARAVIEHRKITIKKPLTAFAAKLLTKKLAEWGDANQAAEIMIEKCWQGFEASWVQPRGVVQRHAVRRTIVDAARDQFRGTHEPSSLFGHSLDDQRFRQ